MTKNKCECNYSEILGKASAQFGEEKSVDVVSDSASFVDLSVAEIDGEQSSRFKYHIRMKERTKNGKEVNRVTFILASYCPFCGGVMK